MLGNSLLLNLRFEDGEGSQPRFWQRRIYDFNVRKNPFGCHSVHGERNDKKEVGRSSKGLAMEQLFVPIELQTRIDPRRSRPLNRKQNREKSNPPPLRKPRRSGHPEVQRPRQPPTLFTKNVKDAPPENSNPTQRLCHAPASRRSHPPYVPSTINWSIAPTLTY